MPATLCHILETRDCVIGDRHAKRKCNTFELVRLLHDQISCGDAESISAAASLFGSLVLECSSTCLDADQLRVFQLLVECVMKSTSAVIVCACLRAVSNCFSARRQPPQLTQQMCSRLISLVLNPGKECDFSPCPAADADALQHDLQVCACRLLSASATFLQFCSEQDAKSPLLKPTFKAALSTGPSFRAQTYSENCTKMAHLAFAAGTSARLTAAILDALASSPRPMFVFGLLQLKQQECLDQLHAGHPSVRAALSRLLIATFASSAAPSIALDGLTPADANRALCRLLAVNETAKQAVQVIRSLLGQRPSPSLLTFFLSQRLLHAMSKLVTSPNLHSTLLEMLFDSMATLTSSCEDTRRAVVELCDKPEFKQGCVIPACCAHIASSSSCLRHAAAKFLLSMSRSPLALRTVFVDAGVAPLLLLLLSSPYFDESLQPHLIDEMYTQALTSTHFSAENFSYSAIVMAIISNCLLPLSLFRDLLCSSHTLVSILCRCSMHSSDRELRTNSLCALSSLMAAQQSQDVKLSVLAALDTDRFLSTMRSGSALDQEFCLLLLRNCADGAAEHVGVLLRALPRRCSDASVCISYFSEFCFGPGSTTSCARASSSSSGAEMSEAALPWPSFSQSKSTLNSLRNCCEFHDCPIDELNGPATSSLENCEKVRWSLASIVSLCSTSPPASTEQLLMLLANIAACSSGRKALILDVLPPTFLTDALTSDDDSVRRVSFLRVVVLCLKCLIRLTSLHAALWLLRVLTSIDGPRELRQQRVAYMSELGMYDLARNSLSDQAASSCLTQLLADADASDADVAD